MRTFDWNLAAALAILVSASTGCSKDPPKKVDDKPKAATPVPSDMVFNDFVPSGGGAGIVGVKTDGGMLEAGAGESANAAAQGGEAGGGESAGKLALLEPGAEPRAPRKYAFAQGKSDRRLLTLRQSAGREGGGPPQEQAFALTVDFAPKAGKSGNTKFDLKVLKIDLPDIPAAQKAAAQSQLAAFVGLGGAVDVSPRGEVGEFEFKPDERMSGPGGDMIVQSLQQALELVVVPLPVEPIGVGAKWERKVESKTHGQEQSAKQLYTLTEVTPEGGVVDVEIELAVPKHPFQARGLPPGATEEVSGKGKYNYTFKFDRVATKVNGEMNVVRRVELSDGKGGPKQSVAETMKMKNQLETVKP